MGEIYSLGQDCQYLLKRAARHRRAGRYDQAMLLLAKAKGQFEGREDVEFEMAGVYEAMGCENEAVRSYLRTACMTGKMRARALYHLSLASARHADLSRAVSYFEALCDSDGDGVSKESIHLLQKQLLDALQRPKSRTRRQRANALAQRAVERLNAGKVHAAKRTISRSLHLHETAQGHVLKACCHLICGEGREARKEAEIALAKRPRYIQAQCVLADACMMTGEAAEARRVLIQAARCANSSDALFSVAVECAKYGPDELTLILTKRLLKREPFHIRALAMRACAFANLGQMDSARKLFARLCVLLPEDTIFDAYYRTLLDGGAFSQRLTLAQDVTQEEAMARSLKLAATLHEDPDDVRSSEERIDEICRLARWAMHSPMAGANVTLIAVIVLSVVNTEKTCAVLFDALTDPVLDDGLKSSVLQAVSMHCSTMPEYADLGGRFVRVAAGTVVPTVRSSKECQDVVQRAAEQLMGVYPDAAGTLLEMWAAYLLKYGSVRGKAGDACVCALEYAYHVRSGRCVSMGRIAQKHGVSRRLAMLYARRILGTPESDV